MALAEEMRNMVDHIVSSYEARIQSVASLCDTTHQILRGVQHSLLDMRRERETLNAELRDNLAQNESLRRKDFDHMMLGILSTQEEREKEVRTLLNRYLNEQKEMAKELREQLKKFKDSLSKGEVQRVKELQEKIRHILAGQDERKEEVTFSLKKFGKEQIVFASKLKGLLAKGKGLRIRDFKSVLKEYRGDTKGRSLFEEGRIERVRPLFGELSPGRKEAAQDGRTANMKLAQQETTPSAEQTRPLQ